MPSAQPLSLSRLLRLLAAAAFGVLFLVRPAYAAGTVSLKDREPTEVDGKWELFMTVDYGGIPHLPHIPMLFSFTPTMLYERSLLDKTGDKPQLTRMPLSNQQAINESIDVGFADASGKVFKITKFDFLIRRDHGFEAGEYDLKITRVDDGVQMGQTIKLILKGDNPIVDRRAIVFAGEKPKKKKDGDADKKKDGDADKKKDDATADKKDDAAADKKDEGDKAAGDPTADPNAPPPVPPKQGGCGCRVDGSAPLPAGGALVSLGLGVLLAARRRRRAA
jgi:MYXO-CTERM domain-containing protein